MKDSLLSRLEELKHSSAALFDTAASEAELYQKKVEVLGKKGALTEILKDLGKLSADDRPLVGQAANSFKAGLESHYEARLQHLKSEAINKALSANTIDVSLPGWNLPRGAHHPVRQVLDEMKSIFMKMGFDCFEGPEIETDFYNFEALNIPPDHPARDMQDTFYVSPELLLRTHTSPVQVHVMQKDKPPIRMIAPGVVYRCDSDMTHTPMFHQIEGLLVDKGIHLGHLKAVLGEGIQRIFDKKLKMKFRPSFFPFTEPSFEMDIECVMCSGSGCRVCKQTGWLEILGCGMVDPAVLKHVKIDANEYSGFAFGIGIERVAMLKYGVNDIRLFFENDLRFLRQFS
ncbi:phenylalanine--tRNA ligase subunit alpha [bacterium]|nr:phenylalanine--tRNA ligase subunit alpha [bacterium]